MRRLRRSLRHRPGERTNEDWLRDLSEPVESEALAELRAELLKGIRIVLQKRAPEKAQAFSEDFVQEAVVRVLERLDTFRGDSRFLTWAQKIAVRIAFTELRRKRWENVSLDDVLESPDRLDPAPPSAHDDVAASSAAGILQAVIEAELSERQRIAIQAVMLNGMPLEEVARRLDTNRNALYKLLHDARKKLKDGLENRGLTLDDLLVT